MVKYLLLFYTLAIIIFDLRYGELRAGSSDIYPSVSNMYVAYIDTVLYISTKYNESEDLIWKFRNCTPNDIWGLDSVGVVANLKATPTTDVKQTKKMLMTTSIGDAVTMPYGVKDPVTLEFFWMGGAHLENNYKTAGTIGLSVYANGERIRRGFNGFADSVECHVENELYRSDNYPLKPKSKLAGEVLNFKIKNTKLDYKVETKMDSAYIIYKYYSNAISQNSTWHDSLLFAHSNNKDRYIGAQGGIVDSCGSYIYYPNSDRVIVMNKDRSYTCELAIDLSFGTYANSSKYLSPTDSRLFIYSTNKIYAHSVRNYQTAVNEVFGSKCSYIFKDRSGLTLPDQPANVVLHAESGILSISWDETPYAELYRIYASEYPEGGFDLIGTTTENYWSTDAGEFSKYFFYVIAGNTATDKK